MDGQRPLPWVGEEYQVALRCLRIDEPVPDSRASIGGGIAGMGANGLADSPTEANPDEDVPGRSCSDSGGPR